MKMYSKENSLFNSVCFKTIITNIHKYNQNNKKTTLSKNYNPTSKNFNCFLKNYDIEKSFDNFDLKSKVYLIILFYFYESISFNKYNEIYNYFCIIQTCFYKKIKEGDSEYVELYEKEKIQDFIKKINLLFFKYKENNSINKKLYESTAKEFKKYINKLNIKIYDISQVSLFLVIKLFYSQLIIKKNEWYLINIDKNNNVFDFFSKKLNFRKFEYSDFFDIYIYLSEENEPIFDKIIKISDICYTKIDVNKKTFLEYLNNVIKCIYNFNLSNKKESNEKFILKGLDSFLKIYIKDYDKNLLYEFDDKWKLYLIILYYFNISDSYSNFDDVYKYFYFTQIFFYEQKMLNDVCYAKLRPKEKVIIYINEVILFLSKVDNNNNNTQNHVIYITSTKEFTDYIYKSKFNMLKISSMNFILIAILFHARLMIENDIYIIIDFNNINLFFSFFQQSHPNEFICPPNFFDDMYHDYIFDKIKQISKTILNNKDNDKEKTFIKNLNNIKNKIEKEENNNYHKIEEKTKNKDNEKTIVQNFAITEIKHKNKIKNNIDNINNNLKKSIVKNDSSFDSNILREIKTSTIDNAIKKNDEKNDENVNFSLEYSWENNPKNNIIFDNQNFLEEIKNVIKKIICYNSKRNNNENNYFLPKFEEFNNFLKSYNIENICKFELMSQFYIIILFYIYLSIIYDCNIYNDLIIIQKIFIYQQIIKDEKRFIKLFEKDILFKNIDDMTDFLYQRKEEPNEKYLKFFNAIKITEFNDFLKKRKIDIYNINIKLGCLFDIIVLFYVKLIISNFDCWPYLCIHERFNPEDYLSGKYCLKYNEIKPLKDQNFFVITQENKDNINQLKNMVNKNIKNHEVKKKVNKNENNVHNLKENKKKNESMTNSIRDENNEKNNKHEVEQNDNKNNNNGNRKLNVSFDSKERKKKTESQNNINNNISNIEMGGPKTIYKKNQEIKSDSNILNEKDKNEINENKKLNNESSNIEEFLYGESIIKNNIKIKNLNSEQTKLKDNCKNIANDKKNFFNSNISEIIDKNSEQNNNLNENKSESEIINIINTEKKNGENYEATPIENNVNERNQKLNEVESDNFNEISQININNNISDITEKHKNNLEEFFGENFNSSLEKHNNVKKIKNSKTTDYTNENTKQTSKKLTDKKIKFRLIKTYNNKFFLKKKIIILDYFNNFEIINYISQKILFFLKFINNMKKALNIFYLECLYIFYILIIWKKIWFTQ